MAGTITFKFLRDLQKKEKASNDLQPVDAEFYIQAYDYIQSKIKLSKGDNSKDQMEMQHSLTTVREILRSRERKVINSALRCIRIGDMPANMLPEEETLFRQVQSALLEYRLKIKNMLNFEVFPSDTKSQPSDSKDSQSQDKSENQAETKASEKSAPESVPAEPAGAKEHDSGLVGVHMIDDIPEFIGEDMISYGPYSEGDNINIPQSAAEILIKTDKARYVKKEE